MSNTADIDWELLAEHLDGGLAGTPEGARVAQLVATDPSWAAAATDLAAALAAVTADLGSLPPAPPMPDDVAARLDAAIAGRLDTALASPPASRPPASTAASTPPASAAAAGPRTAPPAARPASPPARAGRPPRGPEHTSPEHTGPSGRPQRRRRRARWGAGLAVAGAVVAFAAIGLGPLGLLGDEPFRSSDSEDGAASVAGAGEDGDQAERPAISADQDRPPMIASGTDYQPGSPLFRSRAVPLAPGLAPEAAADRTFASNDDAAEELAATPDPVLDRLWADPWSCLVEVVASHEPAPATIVLMDFGTFQGEPAIVIWVTTADETNWVTVAGPDCGVAAAGPDELHRTQLG